MGSRSHIIKLRVFLGVWVLVATRISG